LGGPGGPGGPGDSLLVRLIPEMTNPVTAMTNTITIIIKVVVSTIFIFRFKKSK
jgi:hypothetical protein